VPPRFLDANLAAFALGRRATLTELNQMTGVSEELAARYHPASAPDYIPARQIKDLQLTRLQEVVQRAFDHVGLFRARMQERGLTPQSLRTLEDVALVPFTVKTDLRDTYPFGLFASPMSEIVRLHVSSGTTGKPIVVAYTKADVDVWTKRDGAQPGLLRRHPRRHPFRTLTATGSSPAAWAPIMAPRPWAPPSSPSPAATPSASSC